MTHHDYAKVPCGTCTECCRHREKVPLTDQDDVALYEGNTQWIHFRSDPPHIERLVLQHKKNGECIYLGEQGCTIYADRPQICRRFDCRVSYLRFMQQPRNVRRQQVKQRGGKEDAKVFRTIGKRVLEQHPL